MVSALAKSAIRVTSGIGAGALSCYGVYRFLNSSSKEEYVPMSKRGISSSNKKYEKGSFAQKMIDQGYGSHYLGTGPENKEVWNKMWDELQRNPDYKSKMATAKITSNFSDDVTVESSLNGKCESMYKKISSTSDSLIWICSPSFLRTSVE